MNNPGFLICLPSVILLSTTKKGAVDMPRKPVVDLMTLKDVGAYFGFTKENARLYLHRKKFANAKKIGTVWMIPFSDVKRFEIERIKEGLGGKA